jgi:hypothetical protein
MRLSALAFIGQVRRRSAAVRSDGAASVRHSFALRASDRPAVAFEKHRSVFDPFSG